MSPLAFLLETMAEGPGSTKSPENGGETPSLDLTGALQPHQSKSSSETFLEFRELEGAGEGKNRKCLVCRHCHCKVLKPGYGTLTEREVSEGTEVLCLYRATIRHHIAGYTLDTQDLVYLLYLLFLYSSSYLA